MMSSRGWLSAWLSMLDEELFAGTWLIRGSEGVRVGGIGRSPVIPFPANAP